MSFPSLVYGSPGDEKATSTSKLSGFPLGVTMVIGERAFTHGRVGGTALVVGRLYASGSPHMGVADPMLNKALIPAAAYAIGALTVAFTTGGTTTIATNELADGYLVVSSSTGAGIGWQYKIKSNNSAASG